MADYTQLKTLTIDGVTMGIPKGLGENIHAQKYITNYPSSWSWEEGASVILPKGFCYAVRFDADFPARTTTGTTLLAIGVQTFAGGSWYTKFTNADVQQSVIQGFGIVDLTNSADDVELKVIAASSRSVTNNEINTHIFAVRLIDSPTT